MRAKLWCGGNNHDAAYAKFAGIFVQSGAGCMSHTLLAANAFCFLLSGFVVAAPVARSLVLGYGFWYGLLCAFVPFVASSLCFMTITQEGIHEYSQANGFVNGSSVAKVKLQSVKLQLDARKLLFTSEVDYTNAQ